jgi:hypothetical protein
MAGDYCAVHVVSDPSCRACTACQRCGSNDCDGGDAQRLVAFLECVARSYGWDDYDAGDAHTSKLLGAAAETLAAALAVVREARAVIPFLRDWEARPLEEALERLDGSRHRHQGLGEEPQAGGDAGLGD